MNISSVTTEARGTMKLGDAVRISDPCYSMDVWCAGTLENVKPGEYNCYVVLYDFGELGIRVASITAIHPDFDNDEFKQPPILSDIDVGVDGGVCGIYDLKYFERNQPDENWFDRIHEHACHNHFDGHVLDGQAFVSSSGFGDGSYSCFVRYNDDNQIVSVTIEYISPDELE